MREYYQQELSRLKDELYLLGSMVSNALKESLDALLNHEQQAAVRLIVGDRLINTKRYRITQYIGSEPHVKPLVHIPQMCALVTDMLKRALDAFIVADVETARAIPKEDDRVDELYNIVNKDLIALIVQNPRIIDHANYLSWAAHNLERAADRVTNICERVIYTVTGELIEMDAIEPGMAGIG